MVKINLIEALERFDNDREIYQELIDTFLELGNPDFAETRELLAKGDTASVVKRMHKLKGEALTLGADELAQHSGKIEKILRTDPSKEDIGNAANLLETIENLYKDTAEALIAIRGKL